MRIILSRTDSIGDVVLTLPMAGVLKQQFPDCHIIFLGRKYTRPVVALSAFVDEFVDFDDFNPRVAINGVEKDRALSAVTHLRALKADVIVHVFPVKEICVAAKKAGIPLRIATAGRTFTWLTCNKRLYIPRKNSDLHEAQLNLKLLSPLGITREFPLDEIPAFYGMKVPDPSIPVSKQDAIRLYLHQNAPVAPFTLILHPRSKGSAREWGLENFGRLIDLLPPEKFNILVTGTKEEGESMREFLNKYRERIADLTGKLSLTEFISVIGYSDGLVAASTGPLHLAAALGKTAIGIFAPMRPIFPKRWAPLGTKASYLVKDIDCNDCRKSMNCTCIRSIRPEDVAKALISASSET